MDDPADALRQWVEARSRADAASALGTSVTHLWRIVKGKARPGLVLAFAMQREIGIPAESWGNVEVEQ